mmetsp:Transcript_12971/g.31601  ORF Transcript_12971/g.31601 Transcript_12971/m.31601 type:complete len:1093 (+) Transcript_12971:552-3830(+)
MGHCGAAVQQKVEENDKGVPEVAGQQQGQEEIHRSNCNRRRSGRSHTGGGGTCAGIDIVRRVSSCSQSSSSSAAFLGITTAMSDEASDVGIMEKIPTRPCSSATASTDIDSTSAAAAAVTTASMPVVAAAVSGGSPSSSVVAEKSTKTNPQQGDGSPEQQQQNAKSPPTTTNSLSTSEKTAVVGSSSGVENDTKSLQDSVAAAAAVSEDNPTKVASTTPTPETEALSGHADGGTTTAAKPASSSETDGGDDDNDEGDTKKRSAESAPLHATTVVAPPSKNNDGYEEDDLNEDKVASGAASKADDQSFASIKVVQNLNSSETTASSSSTPPTATTAKAGNDEEDIPWTAQQHRDFVAAIYDVGLEKCSPSVILENMYRPAKRITRERAKSHLQKYRLTKDKGKREFLKEYDSLLDRTETTKDIHTKINDAKGKPPPIPAAVLATALKGQAPETLIGGDAAGLLSFSVLNNISVDQKPDGISFDATPETFPTLSEREKKSSLGRSLTQVHDMLQNLTNVLLKARHDIVDVFPEGQGYESPSSSEDEVEEEEDDEVEEEETEKQDTKSSNLIGRKPSLSSLSSAAALRNHRPPATRGPTVNPVKKGPPPGKPRVPQYRPPSQPTRPPASHPPPPPVHPAYAHHHHQYYGGGPPPPHPPPPGQGYSPYPPPHPHYAPPPGMYGPGPPPMPHSMSHPHPSYSMPPPPYPPPNGIQSGSGMHSPKPEKKVAKSEKPLTSNTAEPQPTKRGDGRESPVKSSSTAILQPRTSPEPVGRSQREKCSTKSDGGDIGGLRSSTSMPEKTEETSRNDKVLSSLSPTPVTTHSRKRSWKSVFDPPPHNKTSPVQSKRGFAAEKHDDGGSGQRKRRSPAEDPSSEISLVSTLVGFESHLLAAGSPYDVDTDELGSSPIKFQRRPNTPSFSTGVKADNVFPVESTTSTAENHPAGQYDDINQSPSELSLASRESFSEHILNQTTSWEYSAVDNIQDHHRHQHHHHDGSYRHSRADEHHAHYNSQPHDLNDRQYEDRPSPSSSTLHHHQGHYSVDRSSSSHRHDSRKKRHHDSKAQHGHNSSSSSINDGHHRSGGDNSLREFSRKFFD